MGLTTSSDNGSGDSNGDYTDTASFVPDNNVDGGINPLTGLLSKAIDTAIDVGGKAIGSKYDTGQLSPDAVASINAAAKQQASATNKQATAVVANYTPQILIGVGVIAIVALVVVLAKK